MTNQQTCKACGRPDKFNFNVPDDVWRAVVPEYLQKRVVCLGCFDSLAAQKGVDYKRYLQTLYFAGEGAAFKFQSTEVSND